LEPKGDSNKPYIAQIEKQKDSGKSIVEAKSLEKDSTKAKSSKKDFDIKDHDQYNLTFKMNKKLHFG